jgi:hypothetical protein
VDPDGPEAGIALLDELEDLGFTNESFRHLHHSGDSIISFRNWCAKVGGFRADHNNQRVVLRLRFVREAYRLLDVPRDRTDIFNRLAEVALLAIPAV